MSEFSIDSDSGRKDDRRLMTACDNCGSFLRVVVSLEMISVDCLSELI